MIFNKNEYRLRREAGLRGQGDKPKSLGTIHLKPDWPQKEVTKKARLKNSKRARKEIKHDA